MNFTVKEYNSDEFPNITKIAEIMKHALFEQSIEKSLFLPNTLCEKNDADVFVSTVEGKGKWSGCSSDKTQSYRRDPLYCSGT